MTGQPKDSCHCGSWWLIDSEPVADAGWIHDRYACEEQP